MKDIIKELRSIGMNEYEAKVYSILYQLKISSVREIYQISEIPRNKIYETLSSLETQGFVSSMKETKPIRYYVTDRRKIFTNLMKDSIMKYASVEETLAEIDEVTDRHRSFDNRPFAFELGTEWAISNHLKMTLARAKTEIILFCHDLEFLHSNISNAQLKKISKQCKLYLVLENEESADLFPIKCYTINPKLKSYLEKDNFFDPENGTRPVLMIVTDGNERLGIYRMHGNLMATASYNPQPFFISELISKYMVNSLVRIPDKKSGVKNHD